MKKHMDKILALSLLLVPYVSIAAPHDFCPGSQCKQVWGMNDAYHATYSYDDHGTSSWLSCDPSRDVDYRNGTLTINYSHLQGAKENTCYIKFDLFTQHPELREHGFLTATITVTSNQQVQGRIWPAFWLVGPAPWPTNGEIDIAEYMPNPNFRTDVNLNGGPHTNQNHTEPAVASYPGRGLSDLGLTHVYSMEWILQGKLTDPKHTYLLKFYLDNQYVGQKMLEGDPRFTDTDQAVVRGMDENAMRIVFDTNDIIANRPNNSDPAPVKNAPDLSYQLKATDVKAYVIGP